MIILMIAFFVCLQVGLLLLLLLALVLGDGMDDLEAPVLPYVPAKNCILSRAANPLSGRLERPRGSSNSRFCRLMYMAMSQNLGTRPYNIHLNSSTRVSSSGLLWVY